MSVVFVLFTELKRILAGQRLFYVDRLSTEVPKMNPNNMKEGVWQAQ